MNIKGLKITDIMNMSWDDLNTLNTKDLKQLTSRLVSSANKRIKRLSNIPHGEFSFAYQKVKEQGRKFSVRGLDVDQTRTEFANVRRFLNMKTSTLKGWKKYRADTMSRLTEALNVDELKWTLATEKKFWKVYRKFEELHSGTFKRGDSSRAQQELTEIFESSDKRRSQDFFLKRINDLYKDLYEENQDEENQEDTQQDVFSDGIKID